MSFNPPSASSAEGTSLLRPDEDVDHVSTHPPPHRRREREVQREAMDRHEVSTHPPPHRRREPQSRWTWLVHLKFQPTLRLIGGGNAGWR